MEMSDAVAFQPQSAVARRSQEFPSFFYWTIELKQGRLKRCKIKRTKERRAKDRRSRSVTKVQLLSY